MKVQLPRVWLFTDPRTDPLAAVANLPRASGIVFRHDGAEERAGLAHAVAREARRRGHLLVVAGAPVRGLHAPRHARAPYRGPRPLTASVHSLPQARAAVRAGAALVFASPLHPTRSHAGGRLLGRFAFAALARAVPVPVVALGGMTPGRLRRMRPLGAYGFAAIDFFSLGAGAADVA